MLLCVWRGDELTMERFETYEKYNGKYIFIGWYPINTDFIDNVRVRKANGKKHLYVSYKYLNNDTAEYKYIIELSD